MQQFTGDTRVYLQQFTGDARFNLRHFTGDARFNLRHFIGHIINTTDAFCEGCVFCEAYKTVFCDAYKTAFCLDAKERIHTLCATSLSEHFPNMEHVCAITCGGGMVFTAEVGPIQHLAVALKRRGVNSFSPLPSRGAVRRNSLSLLYDRQ